MVTGKFLFQKRKILLRAVEDTDIIISTFLLIFLILSCSSGIAEWRFKRQCWEKQQNYSLFIVKTIWRSWNYLAPILQNRGKNRPWSFKRLYSFSYTYVYNFPDTCYFFSSAELPRLTLWPEDSQQKTHQRLHLIATTLCFNLL